MGDCKVWNHESTEIAKIIRQLWYHGDITTSATVEEIHYNPNTDLKQCTRDLQMTTVVGSNMVDSDGDVEISEFSDFGDEDTDQDTNEEIPHTGKPRHQKHHLIPMTRTSQMAMHRLPWKRAGYCQTRFL